MKILLPELIFDYGCCTDINVGVRGIPDEPVSPVHGGIQVPVEQVEYPYRWRHWYANLAFAHAFAHVFIKKLCFTTLTLQVSFFIHIGG